jgi:hypothetical protein
MKINDLKVCFKLKPLMAGKVPDDFRETKSAGTYTRIYDSVYAAEIKAIF